MDTNVVQSLKRLKQNITSLGFYLDAASQVTRYSESEAFYYSQISNVSGILPRQQHGHNIYNNLQPVENPHLRGITLKDQRLSYFRKHLLCKPKIGVFCNSISLII